MRIQEINKIKQWKHRQTESTLYEADAGLNQPLEVEIEDGTHKILSECRNRPLSMVWGAVTYDNVDVDAYAWFVDSNKISGVSDYFSVVVKVVEEIDPGTDKIETKLRAVTHYQSGFGDQEIDVTLWSHDLDVEAGDVLWLGSVKIDKFKGDQYLSVSDNSIIYELDEDEGVDDVFDLCSKTEELVREKYDREELNKRDMSITELGH